MKKGKAFTALAFLALASLIAPVAQAQASSEFVVGPLPSPPAGVDADGAIEGVVSPGGSCESHWDCPRGYYCSDGECVSCNCPDNSSCGGGSQCFCDHPWLNCDGFSGNGCEANTNTSNSNCGGCGKACTGGKTCQNGACACPSGTTNCGGTCANLQSDNSHCGACGNACSGGSACKNGECGCPQGTIDCFGECVSTSSDTQNCGECGFPCAQGDDCVNGSCTNTFACNSCADCSAKLAQGFNVVLGSSLKTPLPDPFNAILNLFTGNVWACIEWVPQSQTTQQTIDCHGSTIFNTFPYPSVGVKIDTRNLSQTQPPTITVKNCTIVNGMGVYVGENLAWNDSGKKVNLSLKNNKFLNPWAAGARIETGAHVELERNVSLQLDQFNYASFVNIYDYGFQVEYPLSASVTNNCACNHGVDIYVPPYHWDKETRDFVESPVQASGNVCNKFNYSGSALKCVDSPKCDGGTGCGDWLRCSTAAEDCPIGYGCCNGDCVESLSDSRCACPVGTSRCVSNGTLTCSNSRTDPQNCGGCASQSQGEDCLAKGEACFLGNCGVVACTTNSGCAALGNDYKCCGSENAGVKACTNVNNAYSLLNCGSCGNVCGSGGNVGRPFCCPSSGTFACSSAPCPPPL